MREGQDVLQNRSQALAVALLLQEGQEILKRGGESGYDEDEDEDVQELRLRGRLRHRDKHL